MRIKAAFLTIGSIAGLIAIPYFLGRLIALVPGSADLIGGDYWLCGVLAVAVVLVVRGVWCTIYDYLRGEAI